MGSAIKWIIFDVSGVLTHFTFTNPQGYKVRGKTIAQKQLEKIYFTDEYNGYMLGEISHNNFVENFIKRDKLDLTVKEFNKIFERDLYPVKGQIDLISQLSKKYKIALATNEGKILSQHRIEKSGVKKFISMIIASYQIKELKPSIAFFKKALERLRTGPEECIFIDDIAENVDSARSLGIKGIQFKEAGQLKDELSNLGIF